MTDQPPFQYSLRTLFIVTTVAAVSFSLATSVFGSMVPEWLTTLVSVLLFVTVCFMLYLRLISTDPTQPRKLLENVELNVEGNARFQEERDGNKE